MKSLGARASGARLERMRASAQWVAHGTYPDGARPACDPGGAFRNRFPVRPGLRDAQAPRALPFPLD